MRAIKERTGERIVRSITEDKIKSTKYHFRNLAKKINGLDTKSTNLIALK